MLPLWQRDSNGDSLAVLPLWQRDINGDSLAVLPLWQRDSNGDSLAVLPLWQTAQREIISLSFAERRVGGCSHYIIPQGSTNNEYW